MSNQFDTFVQAIFRGCDGHISIVTSDTEADIFPYSSWWFHTDRLSEGIKLPIDSDTNLHVYFTPHTYKTTDNRLKGNASDFGSCVWLESDDEYFNYNEVEEAEPSIVVSTSPGRHHVYWLLDEPQPIEIIERINRNLTYKYLKNDKSGWDLTQLLRLPGFMNRKRQRPHQIETVVFEPERRYNLKETFGNIPDVEEIVPGSRTGDISLPTNFPLEHEVRTKFESYFTPQFVTYLHQKQPDRSKALWYLYNECIRMNMPPIEAAALIMNSPNNKFLDSKYRGMEEFWSDLNSAYRMSERGESQHIQERLEAIRTQKIALDAKRRQISELIKEHMEERGKFFYAVDLRTVLYSYRRRLLEITEKNTLFRAFLDKYYGINPASIEFSYVVWNIKNLVTEDGQTIITRNTSHYDPETNLLYISDLAGGMFKLDGQNITHLNQGDEGVLFLNNDNIEPIVPVPNEGHSYLDRYVLSRTNYSTERLTPSESQLLVRAWLYSTFLVSRGKSILVVEGDRGSGKSSLFKCLEWVLTGPTSDVKEFPNESNALREVIRGQHHVFFDGVDNIQAWHQNILSTVATGSQERKRMLYLDNEFATYNLDAALGLSTMDAGFLRNDVVDRSIILRAKRLDKYISMDSILHDVVENRGKVWYEILHELNELVKRKAGWVEQFSTLRMSNFSQILFMLSDMYGANYTRLEDYLKGEQDAVVLEGDIVHDTLVAWLDANTNAWDKEYTARQLYSELTKTSLTNDLGFTKEIKNTKRLALEIKRLLPNLNGSFNITTGKSRANSLTYKFVHQEAKG